MSLARLRAGFSSLKLCLELGAGSFVYGRKLTNKNCRQRLIKSNIFFFAKGFFLDQRTIYIVSTDGQMCQ